MSPERSELILKFLRCKSSTLVAAKIFYRYVLDPKMFKGLYSAVSNTYDQKKDKIKKNLENLQKKEKKKLQNS